MRPKAVTHVHFPHPGPPQVSVHRFGSNFDRDIYDRWVTDAYRVGMARDALAAMRRMSVGNFKSSKNGVHALVSVSIGDLNVELKITPYLKDGSSRLEDVILEDVFSTLCEYAGADDDRYPKVVFPIQRFFKEVMMDMGHSYDPQDGRRMAGIVLADQTARDRFESSMSGGLYTLMQRLDAFLDTDELQNAKHAHGRNTAMKAMKSAVEAASEYGLPLEEMEVLLREAYVGGVMGS